MEADWEFDIGGDAAVIEAHWSGFVDLRMHPERAHDIIETQQLAGLAEALAKLNSPDSRVWTCKTDVFNPGKIDPDELDADIDEAAHAIACYIDILPRGDGQWSSTSQMEVECRLICASISAQPLRCSRVDLVVRLAHINPHANDFGITAYLTACGRTAIDARLRLTECLAIFAEVIAPADQASTASQLPPHEQF